MTTDWPDYNDSQHKANAIAITGAPPLTMSTLVTNTGVRTIAASGQFIGAISNINQPGYEIIIPQAQSGNAETVVDPIEVLVQFIDSGTSQVVGEVTYNFASSTSVGNASYIGEGPSRGDQVQIQIANNGTTSAQVQVILKATSRTPALDMAYQANGTNHPTLTYTAFNVSSGLVASSNFSVTNGTTANRLMPLYCGIVTFSIVPPAQTYTFTVNNQDPMALSKVIFQNSFPATTQQNFDVPLIGSNHSFSINNTGAATGTFGVLAHARRFRP